MPNISAQTKSFIIIFCIAAFCVVLTLTLWSDLTYPVYNDNGQESYQETIPAAPKTNQPAVSTKGWQNYSNSQYNLNFKYKPGWKILAAKTTGDFTVLQVDPGARYYNIKIYISRVGYYVMGGLPTEPASIGGQPAIDVHNMLYGVMDSGYYYTFDVGLSVSLTPDFDALVNSVNFGS